MRRSVVPEVALDGYLTREAALATAAAATTGRGVPMPNRWQTDGLDLIHTIQSLGGLQVQANALFEAILADLKALKDRA